ncbi:hypothetical protein ABK040_012962 [Willaertia magna]
MNKQLTLFSYFPLKLPSSSTSNSSYTNPKRKKPSEETTPLKKQKKPKKQSDKYITNSSQKNYQAEGYFSTYGAGDFFFKPNEEIDKNILSATVIDGPNVIVKKCKEMCVQGTLTIPTTDGIMETISLQGEETLDIETFKKENLISFIIDMFLELYNLHLQKVIHNDIKPQNIVKFQGIWKLIDFEISEKYKKFDQDKCYNAKDKVVESKGGTYGYYSPEKNTTKLITPKSDIYTLGLVILKLLYKKELTKDIMADPKSALEFISKKQMSDEKDEVIKNLLLGMLTIDVKTRSSLEVCLEVTEDLCGKSFKQIYDENPRFDCISYLVNNTKREADSED